MRGRKRIPIPADPDKEALPTVPAELAGEAVAEWQRVAPRLHARGTLTELDRGVLAAYCQAYGRWSQAENALAEMAKRDPVTGGLLIKTTNGNAIQNPLVGIANKALSDMARYSAELGMTPTARARVEASGAEPGKKEQQGQRAAIASQGRFATPAAPKLTIN